MSTGIPIDHAPPATELLNLLQTWKQQRHEYNTLLFVALGVLPLDDVDPRFFEDLNKMLWQYRRRHGAALFELTRDDRAILVKITDFNQVAVLTDLKVEILRLIQTYLPNHFGMVDQTRLLRPVDLRFKLQNAVKFVERYALQPEAHQQAQPAAPRQKLRRLAEPDIDRVVAVNEQIGPQAFAKVFIRDQQMVEIQPGGQAVPRMHEYFVGMDALKQHIFKDVELRGAGNLFNQLTITLDRLLLRSFKEANPAGEKCSLNLNVESVFTRAFESFLGTGENAFANIVFEFRQGNILQQYDEYEVAANLIASRGGTIAVDAVFPETVGIVNLARVRANMAKIFWRQGAETVLPQYADEIRAIQDAGTRLVLCRLDEESGVELGHQLGITLFQGFYVDRLLAG